MRSGGAALPAFSALALTGGFAGTAAAPEGLAAELGESAVFVSAWSAIGNYVNLVLGKQYKCNQTFCYKLREAVCQADFRPTPAKAARVGDPDLQHRAVTGRTSVSASGREKRTLPWSWRRRA